MKPHEKYTLWSYILLALAAIAVVLALSGCATGPNAKRAQMSKTILYTSEQLDRLEKNGIISADDEIEQQHYLLRAAQLLHSNTDIADFIECADTKSKLECSDKLLERVEIYLRQRQ